jgi:hypothetical protein
MYNKLFSKIVDSSIWLESESTRLVWLTMIAVMDQDGFVQMASVANLARRANMDVKKCAAALEVLEAPDAESSDPDYEGRRVERVPGGWLVLNAGKYRDIVARATQRESTRQRVAKFRERKRQRNGAVTPVTELKPPVTELKLPVAQSEAESEADTEAKTERTTLPRVPDSFAQFWAVYPNRKAKADALKAWKVLRPDAAKVQTIIAAVEVQKRSPDWLKEGGRFIPYPATWIRAGRWEDEMVEDIREQQRREGAIELQRFKDEAAARWRA